MRYTNISSKVIRLPSGRKINLGNVNGLTGLSEADGKAVAALLSEGVLVKQEPRLMRPRPAPPPRVQRPAVEVPMPKKGLTRIWLCQASHAQLRQIGKEYGVSGDTTDDLRSAIAAAEFGD